MAYKVTYRGSVTIECETADDAIILAQRLAGAEPEIPGVSTEKPEEVSGRLTSGRFSNFMKSLDSNPNHKAVLKLLLEHPDGITDERLMQTFKFTSGKALGGMLSGLSKFAIKAGFGPGDIYQTYPVSLGGKSMREFKAQPLFVKMAREYGLIEK